MTICIGLQATDGIAIAADAQESDQYYKRDQQKILTFLGPIGVGTNPTPPSTACAFTGAGESGYLDALFDYAISGITTNCTDHMVFETFLKDRVHTFYEKHIFPWASSPNPPNIEILVGAYINWQTHVFVSHGSTVRHAFPHAAVGVGAHYAMSIISELGGISDLRRAEIFAAYVVGMTKERIEGCGKYTDIVSLHNPTIQKVNGGSSQLVKPPSLLTRVPSSTIRKWEESFGTTWSTQQLRLLKELVDKEMETE
jgi:hypothetical protein